MRFTKFFIYFLFFSTFLFAKSNTPFAYYEFKGQEEGPTLLVIGGIHGDEPGGYFAPALLVHNYRIKKGNLFIIPNLNPDSILANRRGIYKDMNRKFAKIAKNDPDFKNVERVKKIITNKEVDLIINLHDGHGFYRQKWENSIFNPRAWGQTYVIDQKTINDVPFGNLDEITTQIVTKLNQNLHYDYHTFGVKNTETKEKDEEQQNSLTFFAITHLKPALAIETSKNIKELELKVHYQLSSIETLMDIMGISYERDFELTREGVHNEIIKYGTLKINDNITLPLSTLKQNLNFIPLKRSGNTFAFSHTLGRIKHDKGDYAIYIGHKKISTLKPDYFTMQCDIEGVKIKADNKETKFYNFGETLEFSDNFVIKDCKNARINVIGFSKKGIKNECEIPVSKREISSKYSLDKEKSLYRIEVYQGQNFCGTINAKYDINQGK